MEQASTTTLSVGYMYRTPNVSLRDPELANALQVTCPESLIMGNLKANLLMGTSDTRYLTPFQWVISQGRRPWSHVLPLEWSFLVDRPEICRWQRCGSHLRDWDADFSQPSCQNRGSFREICTFAHLGKIVL